jgi:glutathione synthase/RimK-type ligase-like ATP-grasp enzyme
LKKLGILTDENNPNLIPSERGLDNTFSKLNIQNDVIIWDQVDWSQYENILIRSPWDYAQKNKLFINKLEQAVSLGINIIHDIDIINWNMDKSYLIELGAKMNVVPTISLDKLSLDLVDNYFEKLGSTLVVKPKIGAGGKNTFKVSRENIDQLKVLIGQALLVQPFIDSIKSQGEYSFIFFDGVFSHAVLKTAVNDEFRIQQEYGGKTIAYEPASDEVDEIKFMLSQLNLKTIYARVDVVRHDHKFFLMELELIEPELFLPFGQNSAAKFVKAVSKYLK